MHFADMLWESVCYCALLFSLLLTRLSYHLSKTTLFFINQAGSTWKQHWLVCKELAWFTSELSWDSIKGRIYVVFNAIQNVLLYFSYEHFIPNPLQGKSSRKTNISKWTELINETKRLRQGRKTSLEKRYLFPCARVKKTRNIPCSFQTVKCFPWSRQQHILAIRPTVFC